MTVAGSLNDVGQAADDLPAPIPRNVHHVHRVSDLILSCERTSIPLLPRHSHIPLR